jgi:hypothetical protein
LTVALALYALTDYATIAAEIGLSGSTGQALIERLIGVASSAIDRATRRRLLYQAGIVEKAAMQGRAGLILDRYPLVVLGAAADDRGPVDPSELSTEDADAGILTRSTGWPWSANLRPGLSLLTLDRDAGTEVKSATITYAGGYITGPQAYGARTWPGSTKSLAVGTLCKPASPSPAQLWRAQPATVNVDLVTGLVEPTWPSSPEVGDALTDGALVWVYLGLAGAAGDRGTAVSLPDELEQACVVEVKARYYSRNRDPALKSEAVGAASKSYDTKAADASNLTADAYALCLPYKRAD